MKSLTSDQITLLRWMAEGQTFEVCSEYCPHRDDVLPKTVPIRIFRKTVLKLYRMGLVKYDSTYYFGSRWDVFSITSKGEEAFRE